MATIIKTPQGYVGSFDFGLKEVLYTEYEEDAERFFHDEDAMCNLSRYGLEGDDVELVSVPSVLDAEVARIEHANELKAALDNMPDVPFTISTDDEHTPQSIDEPFPDNGLLLMSADDATFNFYKMIISATYGDFYRAVAEGIEQTGDQHHVFLEGWSVEDGMIVVSMGS